MFRRHLDVDVLESRDERNHLAVSEAETAGKELASLELAVEPFEGRRKRLLRLVDRAGRRLAHRRDAWLHHELDQQVVHVWEEEAGGEVDEQAHASTIG